MDQKTNENLDIIFPEESGEIVVRILKKYGIDPMPEEMLEKLEKEKTREENNKIVDNLPGRKTAILVREAAEEKLSSNDFAARLQEQLNIPEEKAKNLADDLNKEIIAFAKEVPIEKKPETPVKPATETFTMPTFVVKPPEELIPSKEPILQKKESLAQKKPDENKKPSAKADVYREPIE